MAQAIYTQTIIAMIWDFDRTLIPGYSQDPIFDEYHIDASTFWGEVNGLTAKYEDRGLLVAKDTAYLLHMLTYVRAGRMAGLTNSKLLELGAKLELCPGMPNFLQNSIDLVESDNRLRSHGISIEHYVVSTGIRHLIQGSGVGPLVTRIWANEFVDQLPPPGYIADGHTFAGEDAEIAQVGYMIDDTSKTRAIFEINKGPGYPVNALVPQEDRRVPIKNMIYVADGPSDVPVCSVVNANGGRCLGVYQSQPPSNFEGVKQLEDEGRVHSIAEADFSDGTQAWLWLTTEIRKIADRICSDRERLIAMKGHPPGHVTS